MLEKPAFQRDFMRRMSRVQEIHGGFRQLVENLGRLFELEQERDNILGVM